MAHSAGAHAQRCAGSQALELMLIGQALALVALEVLALMLSSTLGLISLAPALVLSSA